MVNKRSVYGRRVLLPIAVMGLIASCGGSDDTTVDEATVVETTVDEATVPGDSTVDSQDDTVVQAAGDATSCGEIFADAEIEEFFAEPAELIENADVTGLLQCTWETIEDDNDVDDLALQTLSVQFYFGPTIDVSAVFDPVLFEPEATIAGVGDEAFVSNPSGLAKSYHFIDGDTAGMLMYLEVDFETDADPRPDVEVEQLFRTFHERVT
jgi:hypothetical protein